MNKFIKTDIHTAEIAMTCAIMNIIHDLRTETETLISTSSGLSINTIFQCFMNSGYELDTYQLDPNIHLTFIKKEDKSEAQIIEVKGPLFNNEEEFVFYVR